MSNQVIARPLATDAEWEDVFAYLYSLRFPERDLTSAPQPEGNASRGKRVFETKRCVACHADSRGRAVSPRPGKVFTPYSFVALGWSSGRVVHTAMQQKRIRWPFLTDKDS